MMQELAQAAYAPLERLAGSAAPLVFLALAAMTLFTCCALYATFGGWLERKLIARVHSRIGPMYTGPAGILQTVADLLKFLRKEVIFPKGADRILYRLAPFLLTIPPFLTLAFLPLGDLVLVRSDYSLIIVLALLSFGPIAILAGSWASNSKYSTLGGLRAAGMAMSYEIVLGLAAAGAAIAAGSLDIVVIAQHQASVGMWAALFQPVAFVLFIIAAVASVERNPFDLVEAESELVSGWKTEYGAVYFSLTLLGEYIKLLAICLLTTSLFLGGWAGVLGEVRYFGFVFLLTLLMFYIRATALRLRLDQILHHVWRVLIPLALVNIAASVFFIALRGGV